MAFKQTLVIPDDVAKPNRGILKPNYNYRVRSLARTLVDLLEDEDDRKKLRKQMRAFTGFAEIREHALKFINESEFNAVIARWFDDGTKGE